MKLEKKVVVVAGGARDIGRAVSVKLASEGAKVAVNYFNNKKGAEDTLREIEANGGEAILIHGDMTAQADVTRLVEETRAAFGDRIDTLVNVVGGLVARKTLEEMDQEFFDFVMSLNVTSTFLLTRAVCPGMISTTFHDRFTKDGVRANVAASTPLRREGVASEVADAVAYLASDESTFITGVNLDINGGICFP